jgi:hypothetical protein
VGGSSGGNAAGMPQFRQTNRVLLARAACRQGIKDKADHGSSGGGCCSAGRPVRAAAPVLDCIAGRQDRDDRPGGGIHHLLGHRVREIHGGAQDARVHRQVRADVLVGAVAGGPLPDAGPAKQQGHGDAVHGGDARVETLAGLGHAGRFCRCADAHQQGHGRADPEGDVEAGAAAAYPGDCWFHRPVHRPFRHGLGHHELVSRHWHFEEHQPGGGGAGPGGGAVCHRFGPDCGNSGGDVL